MSESVIDLLDALESAIATGRRLPLTPQVMVNEEEALDLIDRARRALPDDLKAAHQVLEAQRRIVTEAEEAATGLRTRAEAEAAAHIDAAHQEAQRRVEAGGAEADRMVREAQEHALALIAAHTVTQQAEARAAETVDAAEQEAERMRGEAATFVRGLLEGAAAAASRVDAQLRRALEALPPS